MTQVLRLNNVARFSIDPQVFDILRAFSINTNRAKLETPAMTDFIDSSGGVAFDSSPTGNPAKFDATSAGGASAADFNTWLGTFKYAASVVAEHVNAARGNIGLPTLSYDDSVTTPGTIPDITTTVSSTNGATALDWTDGVRAIDGVLDDLTELAIALNEVLAALGHSVIAFSYGVSTNVSRSVGGYSDAEASATGNPSIAVAVINSFIQNVADQIAGFAQTWNFKMTQGDLAALVDSTGGTPGANLVANATPATVNGAATTSAPKAGFDTVLNVIENGLSELATRVIGLNDYLNGAPGLVDSTGQTVNGTLEAITNALVAVDGSSGSSAVDAVTAGARMATINNALSSLNSKINTLVPSFPGVRLIGTDALGGSISSTIADVTATAGGVSGAASTMLDTAVNTWLGHTRDNLGCLAAKLNEMRALSTLQPPVIVVAG